MHRQYTYTKNICVLKNVWMFLNMLNFLSKIFIYIFYSGYNANTLFYTSANDYNFYLMIIFCHCYSQCVCVCVWYHFSCTVHDTTDL